MHTTAFLHGTNTVQEIRNDDCLAELFPTEGLKNYSSRRPCTSRLDDTNMVVVSIWTSSRESKHSTEKKVNTPAVKW